MTHRQHIIKEHYEHTQIRQQLSLMKARHLDQGAWFHAGHTVISEVTAGVAQ